MLTVTKRFHFCYGHFLPEYKGKCSQQHGHNAELEVTVSGRYEGEGKYEGMVVDFGILSKLVFPILERFDHQLLNHIMETPTAENMAAYIFSTLDYLMSPQKNGLTLEKVRVSETPDSWAEVTR